MLNTATCREALRTLFTRDPSVSKATAVRRATSHVVRVTSDGITPTIQQIAVGDTITFKNETLRLQNVVCDRGAFDTGLLGPGDAASLTFGGPGDYSFSSITDTQMTGRIHVS